MRGVSGKRPRGVVTAEPSAAWAGRVPKLAMDADSLVDYGSGFLRKSCDSCVSSKRRCDGQDPCIRCQRRKKPCHYTERKKCGPRSGQKSSRAGTRRTRMGPASRTYAGHAKPGLSGRCIESNFSGLSFGSPPPHAPLLSTDELSGDTTGVDFTDVSDAPNQYFLARDGSGSSWGSQDEPHLTQGPNSTVRSFTNHLTPTSGGCVDREADTSAVSGESSDEESDGDVLESDVQMANLLMYLGKTHMQGAHGGNRPS